MSVTFDKKEDKQFFRLLELIDEGFKLFTVAMPVNFIPIFRYIPGVNYAYQKIKSNREETSEFFKKIADEHRQTLDRENIRDVVDAYLVQQDEALTEGKKETYFSEAQLIQIMNDLFSAGLETVTSTLEWAVLFLMRHPEIQEQIHEEVTKVVGTDRSPQLDDLPNMPFTEATMYEVLRRSNVIALGNAHATTEYVFFITKLFLQTIYRYDCIHVYLPTRLYSCLVTHNSLVTSFPKILTSFPTCMPFIWIPIYGMILISLIHLVSSRMVK